MAYKNYSEQDRARLMAYAISVGYPNRRGSKLYASRLCNIDRKTIRKWYKTVDLELLEFEIMELKDLLKTELDAVFEEMKFKREKASYRDLTVAAGIIADKVILLDGGATARSENITGNWKDIIEAAREDDKKKPFKPEMELKESKTLTN